VVAAYPFTVNQQRAEIRPTLPDFWCSENTPPGLYLVKIPDTWVSDAPIFHFLIEIGGTWILALEQISWKIHLDARWDSSSLFSIGLNPLTVLFPEARSRVISPPCRSADRVRKNGARLM
jgi:hypothetical protein